MKQRYFITGTDTGVGKTVVSAILCIGMDAAYWKPVQTGCKEACDTDFVRGYGIQVFPEVYKLKEPLSSHAAAQLENRKISLKRIVSSRPSLKKTVMIEGAGGVLVPLNECHFMIDLIQSMELPAIVVSRSALGTINHTLLSIEALKRREIPVAGVVMVGPRNSSNRAAIENYGQVPVLGEILPTNDFSEEWMRNEFRKLQLPKDFKRSQVYA